MKNLKNLYDNANISGKFKILLLVFYTPMLTLFSIVFHQDYEVIAIVGIVSVFGLFPAMSIRFNLLWLSFLNMACLLVLAGTIISYLKYSNAEIHSEVHIDDYVSTDGKYHIVRGFELSPYRSIMVTIRSYRNRGQPSTTFYHYYRVLDSKKNIAAWAEMLPNVVRDFHDKGYSNIVFERLGKRDDETTRKEFLKEGYNSENELFVKVHGGLEEDIQMYRNISIGLLFAPLVFSVLASLFFRKEDVEVQESE